MRRRDWLGLSLTLAASGLLARGSEGRGESRNAATRALHELFRAEWDYRMQRNPTWASTLGDRRWNDRWDDLSLESFDKDYEHQRDVLKRLRAIHRSQLSPHDQLNYDLFQKQHEMQAEEYTYRLFLLAVNQREGIQTAGELGDTLRFETVKDYEDWIARLSAFPGHMDQTIALLQEGSRRRMLLPKVVMARIPAQIDKQIVAEPEASPFYKPFRRMPAGFTGGDRTRLSAAARENIQKNVVPALQRFRQFFVDDYLPSCFDHVGIWQMPQGDTLYSFLIRKETTTRMTPAEIHDLGLREVERVGAEMQQVMEDTGFKGTRSEFFNFLRTDPLFYYRTPEELLAAYRALAKRVDPELVRLFKTLPRTPYGVQPIPETVAPDTTTAYYRPLAGDGSRAGTYFVNLYRPETRPKWEMTALTLHESVPGHHLAIALESEQSDLPNFRRYGGHSAYTAFTEGWGLYAESLGEEMGLYDDPYSRFGRLTYQMWRAVRLVVDTGIHWLQWDRQKAIEYFMEHTAKQELDVTNEIDRYIVTPAQALAYKIGELKIKGLRARAHRALGQKFDVREFHEAVLRDGAVPLDILERNVEEWIEAKKR